MAWGTACCRAALWLTVCLVYITAGDNIAVLPCNDTRLVNRMAFDLGIMGMDEVFDLEILDTNYVPPFPVPTTFRYVRVAAASPCLMLGIPPQLPPPTTSKLLTNYLGITGKPTMAALAALAEFAGNRKEKAKLEFLGSDSHAYDEWYVSSRVGVLLRCAHPVNIHHPPGQAALERRAVVHAV